jgi:hypothetical protein
MNADVETCESSNYHMSHYYDNNTKWCPGVYRELADAVRAWNSLMQEIRHGAV